MSFETYLLSNPEGARACLKKEYDAVEAENIDLYEPISEDVCRVSLAAWKYRGLPWEWLFELFAASCQKRDGGDMLFEAYRRAEQPAYRIVSTGLLRLFPILEKAAVQSREKQIYVIAIDGRAASGKTTMAAQLGRILGADIVHMDDFFLPLSLRTEERLTTPGGNVHYERFCEEVLPYLTKPQPFAYRRFSCKTMDYDGQRSIGSVPFRIVEGSYSCHPVFDSYADLTVFSDIGPEEQLQRILKRDGAGPAERFKTTWIPMEEQYFTAFEIDKRAHINVK